MSTTAEGGLFPPLMKSYLPAQTIDTILSFTTSETTKGFNFTVNPSSYNVLSDIHAVHVSITRQSNYNSIFDAQYTMGIYIYDIAVADRWTNYLDKNLTIPSIELNPKELAYNEYYKIQTRFCKQSYAEYVASKPGKTKLDYLTDESVLADCSEWSTVCLGRIIATNTINLKGNTVPLIAGGSSAPTPFNDSSITLTGTYTKLNFEPPQGQETSLDTDDIQPLVNGNNDAEYLSSYQVKVYNEDKTELLSDSGVVNLNIREVANEINYAIPYFFNTLQENTTTYYIIDFSYITANQYSSMESYKIGIAYYHNSWAEQTIVDEITSLDSVIGKVSIAFLPKKQEDPADEFIPVGTELTIRRSSNIDDFSRWEVIWKKKLTENVTTEIDFDDFTIESGTLYQYELSCKLKINDDPEMWRTYSIKESYILSVFDYSFLTGEGTQLCVKFNPNISSYKHNVSDNIVTTIGSKYPYITRNGNMNYRTFALSGIIAYEMDVRHQFASRGDIYKEWINVYGSYFVNRYFNQQNDRITQRKFRELVLEYLNNDIPKLFRSTPEGNILVRITDVNITPKQELSRMICDFNCTATEIGEASIENLKLYNIQDFGEA